MANDNIQYSSSTTSGNLFVPIQAPRLNSISRKAIQHFLAERASYEAAVAAQPGLLPVSWAGCFNAIFLRSLLRARIFGSEITNINALTDDIIKNKLMHLVSGSKHVTYDEAMADVKRNVRLDASEPDARLRILMLQTSYMELCERRGYNFVEEAPEAAVQHLIAVLQPPALKSLVEDALKLTRRGLKEDFFGFASFLADEAEMCEKYHPLQAYRASPKGNQNKKTEQTKKDRGGSSSSFSSPSKKKGTGNLPFCLNPDCDKYHYVKDCPQTSPEMKKNLLAAHRAARKEKKAKEELTIGAIAANPAVQATSRAPEPS